MKNKLFSSILIIVTFTIAILAFSSSNDFKTIQVKKGQTIDDIVKTHLKNSSFKSDLLRFNRIKESDIKAGLKLKIPYSISNDRAAYIKFVKGDVKRKSGNSSWKAIRRAGTILIEQDIIKTGKSGVAEIQFDDGSKLKLVNNSQISLKEYKLGKKGGKLNINVKKGAIFAKVNKLKGSSTFGVSAGEAVVGVRGTEFFVNNKSNKVEVEVYEGKVEVSANNDKVAVDTGMGTTVLSNKGPKKPYKVKVRKINWESN